MGITLFCIAVSGHWLAAQEVIKVQDPEYQLSFILPDGWKYKDDGYVLELKKRSSSYPKIELTYFKEEGKIGLDTLIMLERESIFPSKYKGFSLLDHGFLDPKKSRAYFRFSYQEFWGKRYAYRVLFYAQDQRVEVILTLKEERNRLDFLREFTRTIQLVSKN
ncbi:MAG: hypothetical protein ACPF8V_00485 [Luteibaculum sp.]